jgi:hypothetical protein
MNTASGKAKGRRLQQLVRDLLLKLHPSLEEDDIKSTAMGQGGEDVQLSPAARKLIPYTIECKARKSVSVYPWYEQAMANNPKNHIPVLVIKQDRKKPLVVVDAEWFFERTK